METIYREFILDHYQRPAYKGELNQHTVREHDSNPLCGDDLTIDILIDSNLFIRDSRFHGHGCTISQAAADILCGVIIGNHIDTVIGMTREDMLELLGIELGPVRIKCALLAYKIVKTGLIKYKGAVRGETE
ncbi:MAG: iron-sulfur cluster assembly scaffold protein [Candidatus Glassbacteria bacterium]